MNSQAAKTTSTTPTKDREKYPASSTGHSAKTAETTKKISRSKVSGKTLYSIIILINYDSESLCRHNRPGHYSRNPSYLQRIYQSRIFSRKPAHSHDRVLSKLHHLAWTNHTQQKVSRC